MAKEDLATAGFAPEAFKAYVRELKNEEAPVLSGRGKRQIHFEQSAKLTGILHWLKICW